jgi:hypothetical protein
MIVRINQIDVAEAEADAGWPASVHLGAFRAAWPANTRAFELVILSQDEQKQPLTEKFRQQQLRQMIPQTGIALQPPGSSAVLRLDGPLTDRELLPAWRHLTDPDGRGCFAFASAAKLDAGPADISGSVRLAAPWRRIAAVCSDPMLGLESSVRARLLFVSESATAGVLDASQTDDARWELLLAECQTMISTTAGLRTLQIVTRQLDLAQVKSKVMNRLMEVAHGAPAVPA